MELNIKNIKISRDGLPKLIAEIGINHFGSLKLAKKLAKLAIKSGAHIVKHQTHFVDDEMSLESKDWVVEYLGKSIYDLMNECSLSKDEEIELKRYVESLNAVYMSTPFSRKAANFLNEIKVPAFKIGSGECNNFPLIDHIASFKKPVILSTGMNDLKSIQKSVEILKSKKIKYALMHTTNSYPTDHKFVRLGAFSELKKHFKDCPVGLSDHTKDNLACFSSLALGADLLERHFTDNIRRKGPDISCAMTPKQCRDLVNSIPKIFSMRGGSKKISVSEKEVARFAFASVVAIKNIEPNDKLNKNNIWVKRPSTGDFSANDYFKLLGRKTSKKILKDTQLKKTDLK